MDRLTVLGLDLSLTSTGGARIIGGALGGDPFPFRIRSAKKGVERLDSQFRRVGQAVQEYDPDLVVVERPLPQPMRGAGAYYHENAGLYWLVMHRLFLSGRPHVTVPVTTLKRFATGKGSGDKTAMCLAALKRFGLELNPDEADALWLAAAGLQHYGLPVVQLPALQVDALDSTNKQGPVIDWPVTLDWDRPAPVPAEVTATE